MLINYYKRLTSEIYCKANSRISYAIYSIGTKLPTIMNSKI